MSKEPTFNIPCRKMVGTRIHPKAENLLRQEAKRLKKKWGAFLREVLEEKAESVGNHKPA